MVTVLLAYFGTNLLGQTDHSLDDLVTDVIELPEVDPLLAPLRSRLVRARCGGAVGLKLGAADRAPCEGGDDLLGGRQPLVGRSAAQRCGDRDTDQKNADAAEGLSAGPPVPW